MHRRTLLVALGAWAGLAAGCAPNFGTFMERDFPAVVDGVGRAETLTLYEGLPHQVSEAEALRRELATKQTIQRDGFPFYKRPLPLTAAQVEELRRYCIDRGMYDREDGQATRCGEYHPDYCLVWRHGSSAYEMHLCFGCFKMRLYGPGVSMRLSLRSDTAGRLMYALQSHRGQRPDRVLNLRRIDSTKEQQALDYRRAAPLPNQSLLEFDQVAQSEFAYLWEGLPRSARRTMGPGANWFGDDAGYYYVKMPTTDARTIEALHRICSDPHNFVALDPKSPRPRFHTDWNVGWEGPRGVHYFHIDFDASEVQVNGSMAVYRLALRPAAIRALHAALDRLGHGT